LNSQIDVSGVILVDVRRGFESVESFRRTVRGEQTLGDVSRAGRLHAAGAHGSYVTVHITLEVGQYRQPIRQLMPTSVQTPSFLHIALIE
jgi:hypothetical protein